MWDAKWKWGIKASKRNWTNACSSSWGHYGVVWVRSEAKFAVWSRSHLHSLHLNCHVKPRPAVTTKQSPLPSPGRTRGYLHVAWTLHTWLMVTFACPWNAEVHRRRGYECAASTLQLPRGFTANSVHREQRGGNVVVGGCVGPSRGICLDVEVSQVIWDQGQMIKPPAVRAQYIFRYSFKSK
jgi:hypothetical protein